MRSTASLVLLCGCLGEFRDPPYFVDADLDGFRPFDGDCDDDDGTIHPTAAESCDQIDNDCDESVDEPDASSTPAYVDLDADGYGDAESSEPQVCLQAGFAWQAGDCDDDDWATHPDAEEDCDEADRDCDDDPYEGAADATTLYLDADSDGFGTSGTTVQSCAPLSGYADEPGDCDDGEPHTYPGAEEICDGEDNDCNDEIDEGDPDPVLWYTDEDGDGYGTGDGELVCPPADDQVLSGGDCDDSAAGTNPGATEVCGDGDDNDCDEATTCGFGGSVNLIDAYGTITDGSPFYAAASGDIDSDGRAEIAIGSPDAAAVYVFDAPAGTLTLADAAYSFSGGGTNAGFALDGPGDATGDGTADLIVGAHGESSQAGAVYLLTGPLASASFATASKWTGESADDLAGYAVAGADVDKDGRAELAIGAPGRNDEAGAIYVVQGETPGALSTATSRATGEIAGDRAGHSVANVGDIDGDDRADVVVGAPFASASSYYYQEGAAYLLKGPLSGNFSLASADAKWTGRTALDEAGCGVGGGSDTNGDGYADIVVGSCNMGAVEGVDTNGEAYLLLGGTDTASGTLFNEAEARMSVSGVNAGDEVGFAVVGLGDLDGDTFGDIAIGAPGADNGRGRVYVLYGPVTSGIDLDTESQATLTGASNGGRAGERLLAPGDVNGDSYPDLLVGAPEAGMAHLLLGGPGQ